MHQFNGLLGARSQSDYYRTTSQPLVVTRGSRRSVKCKTLFSNDFGRRVRGGGPHDLLEATVHFPRSTQQSVANNAGWLIVAPLRDMLTWDFCSWPTTVDLRRNR